MFDVLVAAMEAEGPEPEGGDEAPPLGNEDAIAAELRGAGFRTIDVHEHDMVAGSMTPAELWRSFARGVAPAVLMRQHMGDEAFGHASKRIVERMERARGPTHARFG